LGSRAFFLTTVAFDSIFTPCSRPKTPPSPHRSSGAPRPLSPFVFLLSKGPFQKIPVFLSFPFFFAKKVVPFPFLSLFSFFPFAFLYLPTSPTLFFTPPSVFDFFPRLFYQRPFFPANPHSFFPKLSPFRHPFSSLSPTIAFRSFFFPLFGASQCLLSFFFSEFFFHCLRIRSTVLSYRFLVPSPPSKPEFFVFLVPHFDPSFCLAPQT